MHRNAGADFGNDVIPVFNVRIHQFGQSLNHGRIDPGSCATTVIRRTVGYESSESTTMELFMSVNIIPRGGVRLFQRKQTREKAES